MSKKLHNGVALLLAFAIAITPSVTLSAGADSDSSSADVAKSDTSRYGTYSKSRFKEAKGLINLAKFHDAYLLLAKLTINNEDEDDRQNLLGFSARKSGELDRATFHYEQALRINPNHKGALEYQGELFLTLGQKSKAENNLKLLKILCPSGCLAATALEAAITKY